jgi:ketosteroid isomerase-like protein
MTDTTGQRALEDRLRRVEDLLEIHQLFIDYGRHLDHGDFASWSELFAEDGEMLLGPLGRAKGRAAIKAAIEEALGGRAGTSYHIISSPAVELDGDTATSEVMWSVVEPAPDGKGRLTMVGRHLDDLVRENGRWHIKRRRGVVDLPPVMPPRD